MACVLYSKDGEPKRCSIEEVSYWLQNGFQKDHPDLKPVIDNQSDGESDVIEKDIERLEDEIDSKEEEIRELAREKGLKRVGNKSIETLLEELDELEAKENAAED